MNSKMLTKSNVKKVSTMLKEKSEEKEDKEKKGDEKSDKKDDSAEEKDFDKLDDNEKKKKVEGFVAKALKSGSDAAIASLLDNFTLGNFSDALCDLFKKEIEKKGADELKKVSDSLHEHPGFEKAKKINDLSNTKDDNTSTDIDKASTKFFAMWHSADKDKNLCKIIENLTVEIQKEADKRAKEMEEVKKEVKAKKIEGVDDGDIENLGPMIKELIDAGKSSEEIAAEVNKLKKQVKESYERKRSAYINHKLLTEKQVFLTEKQKNQFLIESIGESKEYQSVCSMSQFASKLEAFLQQRPDLFPLVESLDGSKKNAQKVMDKLIAEGFLSKAKDAIKNKAKDIKDKVKNSAVGKAVAAGAKKAKDAVKFVGKIAWTGIKMLYKCLPEKFRKTLEEKVKNATEKALNFIKDGGLAPILKIAGLSLMVLSGAWGLALIVGVMMLIEKHGKQLKAAFTYCWERFANSKGVIASMDFAIKDKPELTYSARFFATDKVWRVINTSKRLKHPSKEYAKEILQSEIGSAFVKRLAAIWDPVFSKEKGGKVDFASLFEQSKELKLPEQQIQALNDFREQYDELKKEMNKPAIDTRVQGFVDTVKQNVKDVKKATGAVKGAVDKVKKAIHK